MEIIDLGCNGEGIAKENGKVFFVPFALTEEEIEIEEEQQKNKFSNVTKFKLLQTSKDRVCPKCKYFGVCGGCQTQHLNYQKELDFKTNLVKNTLSKFKINTNVNYCIASEKEYNYRNKITMFVTNDFCLGFNDINNIKINIKLCEIANENLNKIINLINNYLNKIKIISDFIKSVSIRFLNNKYLILFVVEKKINFDILINILDNNKLNYGLFYSINNQKNSHIATSEIITIKGSQNIELIEFGVKYSINPYSFMQVNNEVKQKLYQEVLNNIDENEIVLDAYSGAGLMSAIISKKSKFVYAIEIDRLASKSCEKLIADNRICNLKPICGDCKFEVDKLLNTENLSCVVLDPPRNGCDPKVIDILNKKSSIKKIIYVSCNPATLGRDLQMLLQDNKYQIKSVSPFDMFPKTANVETVVVLEKINKE